MKAFVLLDKLKAELADRPEPKIDSPESVIVGISAVSICGSDSQIYSGNVETKKLPIIMGHEAGGIIEEVGANVRGLDETTKVLVDPNIVDGTCDLCAKGLTNLCRNGGLMGRDADGVFAERISLNADRVYKLPSNIDDKVIPLIQPLSTVVRAMSQLAVNPGDVILVIGVGATGLLFARLCKLRGATVVGARRTWLGHMLPISKEFGVDHLVDSSSQDLAREVEGITGGRGADAVILTANAPGLVQACLDLVRPGGEILQFFNFHGIASYESYQFYKKEVKLFATRSSVASDFLASIDLVTSGKIPLEKMITGTYTFENAASAFQANEDRKQNLKVVISP